MTESATNNNSSNLPRMTMQEFLQIQQLFTPQQPAQPAAQSAAQQVQSEEHNNNGRHGGMGWGQQAWQSQQQWQQRKWRPQRPAVDQLAANTPTDEMAVRLQQQLRETEAELELLRESVHKSAMLAAPVIEVVGESPEVIRLKERLKAQEGAIREMNRKLDENNAAAATSEAVPTSEAAAASEPSATSEAATTSEAAATSAAAAELVRLRERTAVARLRERLGQQEGAVLRELGAH